MAERPSQMTEEERRAYNARIRRQTPFMVAGALVFIAGLVMIPRSLALAGLAVVVSVAIFWLGPKIR